MGGRDPFLALARRCATVRVRLESGPPVAAEALLGRDRRIAALWSLERRLIGASTGVRRCAEATSHTGEYERRI